MNGATLYIIRKCRSVFLLLERENILQENLIWFKGDTNKRNLLLILLQGLLDKKGKIINEYVVFDILKVKYRIDS